MNKFASLALVLLAAPYVASAATPNPLVQPGQRTAAAAAAAPGASAPSAAPSLPPPPPLASPTITAGTQRMPGAEGAAGAAVDSPAKQARAFLNRFSVSALIGDRAVLRQASSAVQSTTTAGQGAVPGATPYAGGAYGGAAAVPATPATGSSNAAAGAHTVTLQPLQRGMTMTVVDGQLLTLPSGQDVVASVADGRVSLRLPAEKKRPGELVYSAKVETANGVATVLAATEKPDSAYVTATTPAKLNGAATSGTTTGSSTGNTSTGAR